MVKFINYNWLLRAIIVLSICTETDLIILAFHFVFVLVHKL